MRSPDHRLPGDDWRGRLHRLHLAVVIDIVSHRVVGWFTADPLRIELVADTLTSACRERRPVRPVIFHSDRGCQYTSRQLPFPATELGIRPSVSRTGQCGGNALAECSSPPSNRSCSTGAPGPTEPQPAPRSSTSSRAGTTGIDCTAASATAVPPNTKRHARPDRHTAGLRQNGTRSLSVREVARVASGARASARRRSGTVCGSRSCVLRSLTNKGVS